MIFDEPAFDSRANNLNNSLLRYILKLSSKIIDKINNFI